MEQLYINLVTTLALVLVLILPAGLLANSVQKNCNGGEKPDISTAILLYIPFYNNYRIIKNLKGSAPVILMQTIGFFVVIAVALLLRFAVPNLAIQLFVTIAVYLNYIIAFISSAYVAVYTANIIDQRKYIPIAVLLPPLANFLLASKVGQYFARYSSDIEGVFNVREN